MRTQRIWPLTALLAISAFGTIARADKPVVTDAPPPPPGFPKFQIQEIDTSLKIGYAVILEDIDGDKKLDIVVVDQLKVVWYQNPTWKKRVILDGKTKPDNVCICALDIDGGGDLELVVGAGWKPFDTKNPGTLQWLKRGKSLDDEWMMHPIACDEPMVHRVRAIDIDGDGKMEVVHVPLMGRDATKEKNWLDGRPVRVMAYKVPAEPTLLGNWKPMVLSEELHVCHNFAPANQREAGNPKFFIVSYEGLHIASKDKSGNWKTTKVGEGDQSNPKGSRGASEVATGTAEGVRISGGSYLGGLISHDAIIGTIEPWHGNSVVVYDTNVPPNQFYKRTVIDAQLKWGHAVKFAVLEPPLEATGTQFDNLIVGVRDNPAASDKFTEKCGVRIYRKNGEKWDRYILDDGGVAVEDLAVGDLDGDGKPDIVAVGRQTFNCRIYWNRGK